MGCRLGGLLERYPSVGVRSISQTKPVGSRQLAKRIATRPSTKDGQPSTTRQRRMQHICWGGATKTLHHCTNRYCGFCCCCCCWRYEWNEKSSTRSAPYNSKEMAALHLFLFLLFICVFLCFAFCKFYFYSQHFSNFWPLATNKCPICAVTGTLEARFWCKHGQGSSKKSQA